MDRLASAFSEKPSQKRNPPSPSTFHAFGNVKALFIVCISRSYYIFHVIIMNLLSSAPSTRTTFGRQRLRSTEHSFTHLLRMVVFSVLYRVTTSRLLLALLPHALASIIIIIYGASWAMWSAQTFNEGVSDKKKWAAGRVEKRKYWISCVRRGWMLGKMVRGDLSSLIHSKKKRKNWFVDVVEFEFKF